MITHHRVETNWQFPLLCHSLPERLITDQSHGIICTRQSMAQSIPYHDIEEPFSIDVSPGRPNGSKKRNGIINLN